MSNIGRSNKWRQDQVHLCWREMEKASPTLYDTITETKDFAYWFNVLGLLAVNSMWSVDDVQNYLRTGSKKKKEGLDHGTSIK